MTTTVFSTNTSKEAIMRVLLKHSDTWKTLYPFDQSSSTSPIGIPAFNTNSTNGGNMFSNGSFSQNAGGVASYSSYGDVSTSWNPNKLDGGTLQVSLRNYSSSNNINLTMPLTSGVVAGRSYVLSFTLQGATGGRPMEAYLRRSEAPNYDLTDRIKVPIAASRKEYKLAFVAKSTNGASIELDVPGAKSEFWLDNITLQEANVTYTNPDDYIVFQYNASSDNKQVSLPGGDFYDATGKKYKGNVTLKPYSSLVLIKDNGQGFANKEAQDISLQGQLSSSMTNVTATNSSDLTWNVTNQNTAASYYEIERSADAVNFSSVGKATAKKGTSASEVGYTFNDHSPLAGKNYYRVKQLDEKGVAGFSKVIMINNLSFKLNPNPAHDVLRLIFDQTVQASDNISKEVVIRNSVGTTVKTVILSSTSNLKQTTIDVSALPIGSYTATIMAEGKAISKMFLKQ